MAQGLAKKSSIDVHISTTDESKQTPSLKSLLKLGDAYWREEIQDLIDDEYTYTWNQVKQNLFSGGDTYENKNDITVDHFETLQRFVHHIKCIYEGIRRGTFGPIYPHLQYYEPAKKEKYKKTPLTSTPSFTPQMGYGTPSNSNSSIFSYMKRTSTVDSVFHLVTTPSLRDRASTITPKNNPLLSPSPSGNLLQWNLHFNTDIINEMKNNPNSNSGSQITPIMPALPFLQSQTSQASTGAAELSPISNNELVVSNQPSTSPFDVKHNDVQQNVMNEIKHQMIKVLKTRTNLDLKLESSSACCLIAPSYRPSFSTGIYGTYTLGYDKEYSVCGTLDQLKLFCESFKRIKFVLNVYQKLHGINLVDVIQIQDVYEHQQLFDDFAHIKSMHIDTDNNNVNECTYDNIGKQICEYFESEFECDSKSCAGFSASYADHHSIQHDKDYEDIAFQQQCHIIHSYFLHSTVRLGISDNNSNDENEKKISTTKRFRKNRMEYRRYLSICPKESIPNKGSISSPPNAPNINIDNPKHETTNSKTTSKFMSTYVGQKEDELWWKDVLSKESIEEKKQQSSNEIYRRLVQNMGVFRWQNPHGFAYGQNQETMHYRPKYSNIKEEALQNEYEPLSKDNWNQALRKSTIFHNSWLRQKMRTKTKSFFEDQVTGQRQEWNEGESISKSEIVTLKLYTDYDKLQFALKKCFRFETFDDILNAKNRNIMNESKDDDTENNYYSLKKLQLKQRLESFYHWRGALLTALNKFGTKFNGKNNIVLYHGINAKMIVKTSQTFAFSGPLSTTSSYHVARTFATAKGMILHITSQFPRLNYCNAFDVSLISDYPEEQEWLVGFMYVRLLKINTRKVTDDIKDWDTLMQRMPLSSWVRQQFFAIHLFDEQIFSMSEDLERILAQFLKVNRYECCENKNKIVYKEQHKHFKDWDMSCMCNAFCRIAHPTDTTIEIKSDEKCMATIEDQLKQKRILPILWQKFDEFRKHPNFRQRVKFDTISENLKRFFMEEIEEKNIETRNNLWSISFEEIKTVYPNIEEIHFMNKYRFDDRVLNNLINYIENNKRNKIKKIVFLYYNYDESIPDNDLNMPLNHRIFTNPSTLNKEALNKLKTLKWKIKHNKNGDIGYKIRIYENG